MDNDISSDFHLTVPVHWGMKWLTAFGSVFFLAIAFLSQLSEAGIGYFLLFMAFSLLEVMGFLLSFSTIQVNQKSITATIFRTKYRMNWDEVETIETDGGTIAFLSNNKCLPINLGFAGKEKVVFNRFLEKLIDQRQIEVKPISSFRMMQKNTKIQTNES